MVFNFFLKRQTVVFFLISKVYSNESRYTIMKEKIQKGKPSRKKLKSSFKEIRNKYIFKNQTFLVLKYEEIFMLVNSPHSTLFMNPGDGVVLESWMLLPTSKLPY